MSPRPVCIAARHSFWVEARAAPVSFGLSSLAIAISIVLGLCARPNVGRVAAFPVLNAADGITHVARMESTWLLGRHFSVCENPSPGVCHFAAPRLTAIGIEQAVAVAILMPKPGPALVRSANIDLRPEPIRGRLSSTHWHLPCADDRGRAGTRILAGPEYFTTAPLA